MIVLGGEGKLQRDIDGVLLLALCRQTLEGRFARWSLWHVIQVPVLGGDVARLSLLRFQVGCGLRFLVVAQRG